MTAHVAFLPNPNTQIFKDDECLEYLNFRHAALPLMRFWFNAETSPVVVEGTL